MSDDGIDAAWSTQSTPWMLLLSAQGPDADPVLRRECLGTLYILYKKPISLFFRRLGFVHPEDREDLAQDLFVHLLEKDLIDHPNRRKGRFRSWLKAVARNIAIDARRQKAGRRPLAAFAPAARASLREDSAGAAFDEASNPEAELDRQWARETIEAALAAFRLECEQEGLGHWVAVFEQRNLPPPPGASRMSTAELAKRHGMTAKQVENAAARANSRFRRCLRQVVRRTVRSDDETEEELLELERILQRR